MDPAARAAALDDLAAALRERLIAEAAGAEGDLHERILAPLGRRVDEAEPLCDARLPDGSCRIDA